MKRKDVASPVILDFFEGENSDDFLFVAVHVDSYNPRMCEMDKWRKGWHAIRCDINIGNGRYSSASWVSSEFYQSKQDLAIREAVAQTKAQYQKTHK